MAREMVSGTRDSGLWWEDEAAVEYPAVYQTTDRPRITKRAVLQRYSIANMNPFRGMKRGRLLIQCVGSATLVKLHVAFETALVLEADAVRENPQQLFQRLRTAVRPNGVLGILPRSDKAVDRDTVVYYGMEAGFAFSHFTVTAVPVADFVNNMAEKAVKEQQSLLVVMDRPGVAGKPEPSNGTFENSMVWFINS